MKWVLTVLIQSYRYLISPVLGRHCRFEPSCSAYALEAVQTHGAFSGGWLAARRLCRCHPFNPGGYDPVPPVEHTGTANGETSQPSNPGDKHPISDSGSAQPGSNI